MPVILDGNNFLHCLPVGEQKRTTVRRLALEFVRDGGTSLTLVFDGPPPEGSPDLEHLGRLTVHYAGAASADDLILRLLSISDSAKDWVVITNDRALGARVRERGAKVRPLRAWRSGRPRSRRRTGHEPKLSSHEIADWEAYFARDGDDTEN